MPRIPSGFLISAIVLGVLAGVSCPLAAQAAADLSLTKTATPDPVMAGSSLVYTLTVTNKGPDDAADVLLSDALPAGTTFESLAQPAGWSCSSPAVGTTGTVSCSIAALPTGSAVFTLTVLVDPGVTIGTMLSNTATVSSSTPDPNPGAESGTATTTVAGASTTVSITKTAAPDPVPAGANLTYTITVSNNSSGDLEQGSLMDVLPAGTTFVSLEEAPGWECPFPAFGEIDSIHCTAEPFAPGAAVFTLVVQVDADLPPGTVVGNQASLTVTDSGRSTTLVASASTPVISPATLSGTKTVSGNFSRGGTVTYTVVLTNGGPSTQADNPGPEFTDLLPPAVTLVDATANSGTALADPGTNTVTWNGSIPAAGAVTITITAAVSILAEPGSTVSNQGMILYDADGDGSNEATALTDDPSVGGAADPTSFQVGPPSTLEIPTLDTLGLVLLSLLLSLGGLAMLRRRRA